MVQQSSTGAPQVQRQEVDVAEAGAETDVGREGGSSDGDEEADRKPRRIYIPWQGSLHATLRLLARPYTVSDADADTAARAMIQAAGSQWQIDSPDGVRKGLDEAALNDSMTLSDSFYLGEGELLGFFAGQLGLSQDQLLNTDVENMEGEAIEAEWPMLEDADLAEIFMQLLDRFTRIEPVDVNVADGLQEQEIRSLIERDPQVEVFAGMFTHNYRDFTESVGLDLSLFLVLEEVIFQQYVWGNPNAVRNLLAPGKGRSTERETDRCGIIHRETKQLLYDESGTPLWSEVGLLLRDIGHRASEPLFKTGPGVKLDPATEMLFSVLMRNFGDPLVVGAKAAELWLENPELQRMLRERVLTLVGPQLVSAVPMALGMFAVFAGLHFLAQFLIRTGHPIAQVAGIALEAGLKGVEFYMDIDFGVTLSTNLVVAGSHLARVQFEEDRRLDTLSERHVEEAAKPIAKILVELIMEFGMRKVGGMFGRAAAGETKLHVDEDPLRLTETDTKVESKPTEKDAGSGEEGEVRPAGEQVGKAEPTGKDLKSTEEGEVQPADEEVGKAKPQDAYEALAPELRAALEGLPPEHLSRLKGMLDSHPEEMTKALEALHGGMLNNKSFESVLKNYLGGKDPKTPNLLLAVAQVGITAADIRSMGGTVKGFADNIFRVIAEKIPSDAVRRALVDRLQDVHKTKVEREYSNIEATRMEARLGAAKLQFLNEHGWGNPKKDPCFVPGTLVHAPYGARPIESIQVGDPVLAWSFADRAVAIRSVTATYGGWTDRVVSIGLGHENIRATGKHPFWSEGADAWVDAASVRTDTCLRTPAGERRTPDAVDSHALLTKTHNIEVEVDHCYFVGKTGVLVHNGEAGGNPSATNYRSVERRVNLIYVVVEIGVDWNTNPEKVLYVGKTFQNENKRWEDHLRDAATQRASGKTQKETWSRETHRLEPVRFLGETTPFETAVWERHFYDLFREHNPAIGNEGNMLTEATYEQIKAEIASGLLDMNPCAH